MHEPCFDTLRTKEQLGYTVVADARSSRGIVGYIFMVQSSNSTMAHVEARVSAFIDVFAKTLREMDVSEFETQRSALIARKLECDDSLNDEAERHWGELKVGSALRYPTVDSTNAARWLRRQLPCSACEQ